MITEKAITEAFLTTVILAGLLHLTAWIAYRKGRSYFVWWMFAELVWPIALIAALCLRRKPEQVGSPGTRPGKGEICIMAATLLVVVVSTVLH